MYFKNKKKNLEISKYLNNDEKKFLEELNKSSNNLKTKQLEQNNILNLPIKIIFDNWKVEMRNIILDLTETISEITNNNSKYFNDIDNTNEIFKGIYNICNKLINIFTKEERSIYFGITLIILSMLLYIIQITS